MKIKLDKDEVYPFYFEDRHDVGTEYNVDAKLWKRYKKAMLAVYRALGELMVVISKQEARNAR